jgi:ribonuclease BN (tRNA processing enzyme)
VSIRLTILGKSPSWQDRDGACSGYLVEAGGQRLLIDCGNGVFGKLRRHVGYETIDEIVISHLHADHILDLIPFAYVLTYGPQLRSKPPRLHAPPGSREALRRICGVWNSDRLVEQAFELVEYDPAEEIELVGLRGRFQLVPHYVPSYALDLDGGGSRLTFSADCGPNEELVELARGCGLLLIEATLAEPDLENNAHLTAGQAGEIARRAGAARMVVTHFSDVLAADVVRARAEEAFGGTVDLAVEGASFEL